MIGKNSGEQSPRIKFPTDIKPKSWNNVPAGDHKAELFGFAATETKTGVAGYKLTWLIEAPDSPTDYLVANSYFGGGQELLWTGMREWLGDDLVKYYLDGEDSFCPSELIGLEADIHVKHVKGDGFDQPLARATRFARPGTLVKNRVKPVTREEKLVYGLN